MTRSQVGDLQASRLLGATASGRARRFLNRAPVAEISLLKGGDWKAMILAADIFMAHLI